MATEVGILFKIIDQATAALKTIGSSMGGLDKVVTGFKGSWNKLSKDVPALGSALSLVTNPLTLVSTGIAAAGKLIKDSVGDWVAYNKEIREMTQVTGVGAEEISRIVQAGDDWGIGIGELRTSLAYMNKQGVKPSIANLADLADEYVNSADKTAFAEKAAKLLGRGYQTLIPLFAQGGDALRDMTDAVDDSLIATDESIASTRELEVAQDNLSDKVQGLKNSFATAFVPVMTDAADAATDLFDALTMNEKVFTAWDKALAAGVVTQEEYNRKMLEGESILISGKDTLALLTDKIDEQRDAAIKAGEAMEEEYGATSEAERAAAIFGTTLSDTSDIIDGEMIPSVEGLRDALSDADAMMQGYTKNMIYNTVAAGLNKEQQMILAESMGLIDEQTRIAIAGVAGLTDKYDLNEDGVVSATEATDAYLAELVALKGVIDGMNDKTVNVKVNVNTTYTGNPYVNAPTKGGDEIHYAKGTDFIIPPGYPNDDYPIGYGTSGERVIVVPKSEQRNTNNYTLNVHTNAQTNNLTRDFGIMRAMAG